MKALSDGYIKLIATDLESHKMKGHHGNHCAVIVTQMASSISSPVHCSDWDLRVYLYHWKDSCNEAVVRKCL